RVQDMDAWIQLSSDSLQQFTGKSLFDYMSGVTEPSQVHDHERYAVLSHGVQDDPIYCYFNKAAFLQFEFSEDEVYQLPRQLLAIVKFNQDKAMTRELVINILLVDGNGLARV
ncbi:MAG: hypothetical protein SGILL_004221, partial [Bacillariaceae sp.]